MTTRPGGQGPRELLKIALIVVLAILGLFVAYLVAGVLERALDTLPGAVQLVILLGAGTAAFAERRYFARDRMKRDLEAIRTAAVPAAPQPAPACRANAEPSPWLRFVAWREREDARFVEQIRREVSRADEYAAAAAADAILHLDSVLASRTVARVRQKSEIDLAIADVLEAVDESTTDLEDAIGQVTNLCVAVVEHIEENRRQDTVLESVVAQQRDRPQIPCPQSEILCLERGEWIGGVEIIDLTGSNGSTRDRLRRESDGYIFPRSFDAEEVRLPEPEAALLRVRPDLQGALK